MSIKRASSLLKLGSITFQQSWKAAVALRVMASKYSSNYRHTFAQIKKEKSGKHKLDVTLNVEGASFKGFKN